MLATVATGSLIVENLPAFSASTPIDLSGQFGFSYENHTLNMKATDVRIQGLTIPVFSWGWAGLALASGVLSGFGTAIFGALSNLLFKQPSPPSIEDLLAQQLERINALVKEAIASNEIQKSVADLNAYSQRFDEYNRDHDKSDLPILRRQLLKTMKRLEGFNFVGYRPYMVSAAQRLAVIQEQMKVGTAKRSDLQSIFDSQREIATAHHSSVQNRIDLETSMSALVQKTNGEHKWTIMPRDIRYVELHDYPLLSERLNGKVWVYYPTWRELTKAEAEREWAKTYTIPQNAPPGGPEWISLKATRTKLSNENTAIGAAMIEQWKQARLSRG